MKKIFVVSDIHGYFQQFKDALNKSGFDENNQDHLLVCCGDLLDRGPQPRECLKYMNQLYSKGMAVLIKGNHETLMEEMLDRGYPLTHDRSNGTLGTVHSMFPENKILNTLFECMKWDNDWLEYQSHLVNFYETNNYIFTHGWIPVKVESDSDYWWCNLNEEYDPDWREHSEDIYWDDYPYGARWLNGIRMNHNGVNKTGKTIVCGHYHTSYGWARYMDGEEYEEFPPQNKPEELEKCFKPYKEEGLIAIDACTAYSGLVNVVVLEDELL